MKADLAHMELDELNRENRQKVLDEWKPEDLKKLADIIDGWEKNWKGK